MYATNPYAPPAAPARPLVIEAELDAPLASRSSRFVAVLLDWVMTGVLMLPGVIVGGLIGGEDGANLLAFGSMALFWGFQWLMVASRGQTLGKRWCGIQIVGTDGAPIGFVRGVLLRSWVAHLLTWIPLVGGLLGLANVLSIFGSQRRCLHDRLAGSKVVVSR